MAFYRPHKECWSVPRGKSCVCFSVVYRCPAKSTTKVLAALSNPLRTACMPIGGFLVGVSKSQHGLLSEMCAADL
jgi:hypothetical protein